MKNKMIIELKGVEFKNKGAELMLMAILEKLRSEFPNATIVMERRSGSVSMNQLRKVGVFTKLKYKKYGIEIGDFGQFIPKFLRRKAGFILDNEINVIIDSSGFAYGDFWGAKKAGDRLANHIKSWKEQGKKIILLPQAFGSFEKSELRGKMQTIISYADYIFARDKYSLDYINDLEPNASNIDLKPDFTNLIKGEIPQYFQNRKLQIAIIPNHKLIESNIFEDLHDYVNLLIKFIEKVRKDGYVPFFLIHEGAKDLNLAIEVNSQLNEKVEIITEENTLFIKGIIGASDAVITSRFHGLVSSLSQAVPCLCLGWSHKYEALLEEYGYISALINKEDFEEALLSEKIKLITDDQHRYEAIKILKTSGLKQKELSNVMWSKVFEIINS